MKSPGVEMKTLRVKCDAKEIRKKITEMKMRLIKVALKATGRG